MKHDHVKTPQRKSTREVSVYSEYLSDLTSYNQQGRKVNHVFSHWLYVATGR